jgi:hypothetical protein
MRSHLEFDQLPALTEWALRRGWKQEESQNPFEVLRLRSGKQCAIFHRKSPKKAELTVWGDSDKLAREFVRWTAARETAMESRQQAASA